MKSKIIIKKIIKKETFIEMDYEISENLLPFFNLDNKFKVNYYRNVESVPDSIAVIPFISNVLPIIWLTDSELIVDELDYNYLKSIDKTRKSFIDMYKKDILKEK